MRRDTASASTPLTPQIPPASPTECAGDPSTLKLWAYGAECRGSGYPEGAWRCECGKTHSGGAHDCPTCQQRNPADRGRDAAADSAAPVAGWEDAAFAAPLLNPWVGLESVLQAHCETDLLRRGVWYLHLSPQAREKEGTPDLIFTIAGTPFAIELKNKAGRLSSAQRETLVAMRRNGWIVAVCRSLDALRWAIETKRGNAFPQGGHA